MAAGALKTDRGRLFVLEGPDGVGKSSLSAHLTEHLAGQGRRCLSLSFPGREPGTLGSLVYRLHHEALELGVEGIANAALQAMHVAAHIDCITRRILPALQDGIDVVLDRYWWSTVVYGAVDGADPDLVECLIAAEQIAWKGVKPHRAFLITSAQPLKPTPDLERWHRLVREYDRLTSADAPLRIANDGPFAAAARLVEEAVEHEPAQMIPRVDFHVALSPSKPTKVIDTYWRFAAERQRVFFRRLRGFPGPWTEDPILSAHRFTNAYRASDRVSQYLIRHVQYGDEGPYGAEDTVFRTLLFKLFNRIETWEAIVAQTGDPKWSSYSFEAYDKVLTASLAGGDRIYSAAYIMPPGGRAFGHQNKHRNHLALIEYMMQDGLVERLGRCKRMQDVFELLRSYPTLGDFLAYQFATDLNYSDHVEYSEMDFVVPGPGALDGMKKCFADRGGLSEPEIIRLMADVQDREFERLGLDFQDLWGRPLQLIDCQNLFCEVDKYARVAHPEVMGITGRTRIKQRFSPRTGAFNPWYPPKWGLNSIIRAENRPSEKDQFGGLFDP